MKSLEGKNWVDRPIKNKAGKMEIKSIAEDQSTIKIVYNGRYPRDYELHTDKNGDYYFMFQGDKIYL